MSKTIEVGEEFNSLLLPFNYSLDFPQKSFVTINDVVFAISYRINTYDGSFIMTIKRTQDGKTIFHGKVVEEYYQHIYEPDYGLYYMLLMPKHLERTNMEVRVVIPGLNDEEY